jgi:nucleoside-diphosphate-sugar epimerase
MRVFVTGATGFVGAAVVQDLLAAGHRVLGLARSEAAAAALVAAGVDAHRGSLKDLESLRAGAALADGVIHTAFDNADLSKFVESSETERRAIEAFGDSLEGSQRPLIVTAGFAFLVQGRPATENDARVPGAGASPRVAEQTAMALAERGVRAFVVRLPCVHGPGDRYTVPRLIDIARKTGASAYVGDGLNRWSAVHSVDAARLYRLALESGIAGTRYHAVAEEGVRLKDIAEVIGRRLNLPVRSKTPAEAFAHFGMYALFARGDIPASSALTRERLGWRPTGPGLLADIDQESYYES